jgi:hypothetical protein
MLVPPPATAFDTILVERPDPVVTVRQEVDAVAIMPAPVQVSVIPFALIKNDPPAVTPTVAAWLRLLTVGDVSIVTVNVLL